jgi:hypothetical protein
VYGTLPNGVYATNTKTENSRDQPNQRAYVSTNAASVIILLVRHLFGGKNIVIVFYCAG